MSEIAKAIITLTMTGSELELKIDMDGDDNNPLNEMARAMVRGLKDTLVEQRVCTHKSTRLYRNTPKETNK